MMIKHINVVGQMTHLGVSIETILRYAPGTTSTRHSSHSPGFHIRVIDGWRSQHGLSTICLMRYNLRKLLNQAQTVYSLGIHH